MVILFVHNVLCRSEFGQNVAEEYLKFFDFENVPLDQALRLVSPWQQCVVECLLYRQFVCSFTLSGETHEQERIVQHFSRRYHDSNPNMFATAGNLVVLL